MIRLLITGSRDWTDELFFQTKIRDFWLANERPHLAIVHGGCPTGIDKFADDLAIKQGFADEVYPADWSKGKAAGPIRNQQMVDTKPDYCFAFIKNNSRGATHCANAAKKAGIPTVIFREP